MVHNNWDPSLTDRVREWDNLDGMVSNLDELNLGIFECVLVVLIESKTSALPI